MRAVLVSEFGGPDQQTLRPVVSHVLPLAAAAEAHRVLERRHASGKIILDVTH